MANDFTSAYLKRKKELISPAGQAELERMRLSQSAQVVRANREATSAFRPKVQTNYFTDTPRADNNTVFDVDPGKIGTGKLSTTKPAQTTREPKYSPLKSVEKALKVGANMAAQGFANTLAFAEDVVSTPFEIVGGQKPGELSDTGPFNRLAEKVREDGAAIQRSYEENTKLGGSVAETLESVGIGTVAALPNAILAVLTGGQSAVAQSPTGLTQIAGQATSPSVASTVANMVKSSGKNPLFWSSFAQTAGNSYEESIADQKANGETNEALIRTRAALYAIGVGLINSQVEVGGGIETLPQQMQGGTKPWRIWVNSMFDEGKEELVQGVVERALKNPFYDQDNPLFSVTDENAVLNPVTSAQEFAAGAVAGGLLSGGQMVGLSVAQRSLQKISDTSTGRDLKRAQENFDLVDQGLTYEQGSKSQTMAQSIAQKLDASSDPLTAVTDAEYGRLYRAMRQELDTKGPKTAEQRHDAVQAMHPDEKVVTPTAQAFIDAGESPAKADAKSVILDRVLSGDDTVTDAQLRKLDLQSPATRQVFTAFTGIQVPTTTDTKTLLATFRSAISEAKQVQQLQAALERDTMASVTALRQQAEAAAVASESRAQEQVEAQPAAQETAAAQGIDQKVVKAAQAALKGDVFSGARGKKLEQLGLSREDVTAALQQVASGQPDMSSATVQQVAGVLSGGKRKTTAGDVFRPKGETKAQAELAVRDTRPTPDVQLSDGTSMTAQEFVDDYIATHEGATVQDANRVYSEAVRLNQTGMKFPAARKQESTAARSSVSPRRRKATSEGKRTTQRKPVSERTVQADAASVKAEAAPTSDRVPSRVQRWTASYASALLKGSKIKGIDVAFDGFGEGERGFYQDGRIVLNGNMLTTQRAIMQVLGHELTHPAYDADQTIVNDILATARKFRGDEWMDRAMDETRDRYIRFLMEQKGLTRDEATAQMTPPAVKQEVAGDFMFDVFSDGSLTRRLGSEAPSILYKARSLAARLLERLAGVRGTDAAAARSELEWLVDRLDGALRVNESDDTMGTKRSSVEDPVFQTEEKPIPYLSDEQEQQWEQRINEAAEKFGLKSEAKRS